MQESGQDTRQGDEDPDRGRRQDPQGSGVPAERPRPGSSGAGRPVLRRLAAAPRRGLRSLLEAPTRRHGRFDVHGLPAEPAGPPPDGRSSADPSADPAEDDLDDAARRAAGRPVYTGFMFAVGVGLALLIYYVAQANTQLLVWIGAALFIALGLDPVVRGLERLHIPRLVGVLLTMVAFLGAVSMFIASIAPTVTEQMTNFVTSVPQIVGDVSRSEWFRNLDQNLEIESYIDTEVNRLLADPARITTALGGLFGVGAAVLSTGFGVLVVTVLALYFLAALPTMKAWAYRLAPRSRRVRIEDLAERILNGVGYYVIGQACVAVLNGIVAYIAITIAGVPFGALFAVAVGVLAFIPLVGPVIGGTLVTLVALTVDWQTALTFAAVYFVYLQVEAYFVSPRIMARAVRIPAAVAVISVIAGGTLLGVLGALMAIPTAAAAMLLIREVLIAHQDRR